MTYHDALMNQLTTLVTHVRKLRQRLQHVDNKVYKVCKPVTRRTYDCVDFGSIIAIFGQNQLISWRSDC